jgi:hypothetical protein
LGEDAEVGCRFELGGGVGGRGADAEAVLGILGFMRGRGIHLEFEDVELVEDTVFP